MDTSLYSPERAYQDLNDSDMLLGRDSNPIPHGTPKLSRRLATANLGLSCRLERHVSLHQLERGAKELANARREPHCECSPEGNTHCALGNRCSACVCSGSPKNN